MLIERLVWPHGKVCAAMLSVNLDAEFFGRIYYPDVDVDSGDILSLGRTGTPILHKFCSMGDF